MPPDDGTGTGSAVISTPSSTGVETLVELSTPASPAGGDSGQDFDHGFMNDVFGSSEPATPAEPVVAPVEPVVATPTPAPATPAQPVVPQPPTAPAVAQPVVPPVQPTVQPVQPGVQPSGQQGEPLKYDPADPISLARALTEPETFNAAVEHLATTAFALSPTDLEGLEVNIAQTVPRLLAKAVVYMQTQMLTNLSRIVPMQIQRHQAVTQVHDKNLGEFYSAWPSLSKDKHEKLVNDTATLYRKMNPQASKDQMIQHVGQMVLANAGLPIVAMAKAAAAAAAPASPTAPAPKPAAFVPAAPGTVANVTAVPDSPWDFMGQHST